MLVLDHARHRSEGAVGDMPCNGAAKLAGRNPPGLAVRTWRNRGLLVRTEQRVEMVAIVIDLTDDLRGNVRLAAPRQLQHGPERIKAAGVGRALGQ